MVKSLRKSLLAGNELVLAFAAVEIDRKAAGGGCDRRGGASIPWGELPRSDAAYKRWFDTLRSQWHAEAVAIGEQVAMALKAWSVGRTTGAKLGSDYRTSQDDCWQNMRALLASQTLRFAGRDWLREYPRYAKAAEHRISRLNGQYLKDQKALEMLTPW